MKPYIALLICCFVGFSCSQNDTTHLSRKKMQAVLQDIHLAEAYSIVVNQDSAHKSNEKNLDSLALYYSTIFKHHKTDEKEFEKSLQWYKQNPEQLDSVYAKMVDQVTLLEGKYNIRKP